MIKHVLYLKLIQKMIYINASYINMPIISTDIVNRYIATQGPLPTTCESFWRMIWEQKMYFNYNVNNFI